MRNYNIFVQEIKNRTKKLFISEIKRNMCLSTDKIDKTKN